MENAEEEGDAAIKGFISATSLEATGAHPGSVRLRRGPGGSFRREAGILLTIPPPNRRMLFDRRLFLAGYHTSGLCTAGLARASFAVHAALKRSGESSSAVPTFVHEFSLALCVCCAAAACVFALRRVVASVSLFLDKTLRRVVPLCYQTRRALPNMYSTAPM